MPSHVLKTLDLTTLRVALDHLEEFGPAATWPDPEADPAGCVYLAYVGEEQLAVLAARLPHVEVLFRTPADPPRNKVVRKVFARPAVLHVLRFALPDEREFDPFVRDLAGVNRRHWRVLPGGQGRVRIEFEVNSVRPHPGHTVLIGRVHEANVRVGDAFKEMSWRPWLSKPVGGSRVGRPIVRHAVALRVEAIEAYGRARDSLSQGMTGGLRLTGAGQTRLRKIDPSTKNGAWLLTGERVAGPGAGASRPQE